MNLFDAVERFSDQESCIERLRATCFYSSAIFLGACKKKIENYGGP